jgi:hypothetical protein
VAWRSEAIRFRQRMESQRFPTSAAAPATRPVSSTHRPERSRRRAGFPLGLAVWLWVGAGGCDGGAPPAPRLERVYALQPEEGVFAYARISPDGRTLAYASETRPPAQPARLVQTPTGRWTGGG